MAAHKKHKRPPQDASLRKDKRCSAQDCRPFLIINLAGPWIGNNYMIGLLKGSFVQVIGASLASFLLTVILTTVRS